MSESAKTAPTVPSSDAITSPLPGSVVLPEYGPGHSYRGSETRVGATMPSGGGPDEDYGAGTPATSRHFDLGERFRRPERSDLCHKSAHGTGLEKRRRLARFTHRRHSP